MSDRNDDIAVHFEQVSKTFTGKQDFTAISGLSFGARRGEHVSIVGRTGCGKSTTVNLLLGLEKPTAGEIRVLGFDPQRDFLSLRGRIGCVFQSDRLLPWRTALENVRVPLEVMHSEPDAAAPRVWLARVGLAGFENAYPHELSGGMRQRVALARALVSSPDVLIADEAFGHLDEVTAHSLRAEFRQIAKTQGNTVIQITHSLDEAIAMSDRILVFGRPGHVVADLRVADYPGEADQAKLRRQLRDHIESAPAATWQAA